MLYQYCPMCGEKLVPRELGDEGLVPFCGTCETPYFKLAKPCVLVLTLNADNKVALLRQGYISKTHWVMVAGYHTMGETVEEAAAREVNEETGLTVTDCRYVGSYYHDAKNLIILGFFARVEGELANNSSEVDDLQWFDFDEIEPLLRPDSAGLALYRKVRELIAGG